MGNKKQLLPEASVDAEVIGLLFTPSSGKPYPKDLLQAGDAAGEKWEICGITWKKRSSVISRWMQPVKLGDAPWTCHVRVMDLQRTPVWWLPWEDIPRKLFQGSTLSLLRLLQGSGA